MNAGVEIRRILPQLASGICIALIGSALVLVGGTIHARAGGPVGGHAFLYSGGVMTDLGILPGGVESIANGINSQGQVVGSADAGSGSTSEAFLWTAQSGMVDLNTMLPANSGWTLFDATGINDSGQITGVGSLNSFSGRGFILTLPPPGGSASIVDIGVLPGGSGAFPFAINNSGQVVGQADEPNPNVFGGTSSRAFLYSAGTMTSLGALTATGDSAGADINDGGQVAGTSETNQVDSHAFLYTQGAMMDLGTGAAQGINNTGQVVGQGFFNGAAHAFVYSSGTTTDLGTLPGGTFSDAFGINLAGKIVGFADTGSGSDHAVLFDGATVTDIGTLPGFDGSLATRINAAGQIVGVSWPSVPTTTDTDLGLTGVPANITVAATHLSGSVVTYTAPTAVDEAGDNPAPTVSCAPSSGSTFVIGITTVTCTASDADDTPSTVSGTFTVTVTFRPTPASVKADVNQYLANGMIKNAGVANSLLAKLDAASVALASGDCAGAAASYQAFINELQAQSGKGVAPAAASALIAEVQFLIAHCP